MKRIIPWIICVIFLGWAVSHMFPRKPASEFNVTGFGELPVLAGGRVMPLDTLARVSLSQMNHHGIDGTANNESSVQVATQSRWLLDVFMMPEHADIAKVFEVTNPDILDLFGWQKGANYSFSDLQPFFGQIEHQAGGDRGSSIAEAGRAADDDASRLRRVKVDGGVPHTRGDKQLEVGQQQ